jgi:hypothetical protein
MTHIPDQVRFKGTHMIGRVVVIYGDEPNRLLKIRWNESPVTDSTLYHETEVEPIEKREREPSRLYGSQDWGKFQREEARTRDLKAGYVPPRTTRG